MFTYHYDHQTGQWHIFEVVDGHELYICSVNTVDDAIAYCQAHSYRSGAASSFAAIAREVGHAC